MSKEYYSLIESFAFDFGRITGKSEQIRGITHVRCIEMVAKYGAVEAAKRMITTDYDPEGYKELENRQKLQITTEELVLKEKYRELFEPEVLEKAEERLRQSRNK